MKKSLTFTGPRTREEVVHGAFAWQIQSIHGGCASPIDGVETGSSDHWLGVSPIDASRAGEAPDGYEIGTARKSFTLRLKRPRGGAWNLYRPQPTTDYATVSSSVSVSSPRHIEFTR
jgi:hypothetical protein